VEVFDFFCAQKRWSSANTVNVCLNSKQSQFVAFGKFFVAVGFNRADVIRAAHLAYFNYKTIFNVAVFIVVVCDRITYFWILL